MSKIGLKRIKMIRGQNADYSPRFYFVSGGAIFARAGFEWAYKNGFTYKFVDVLKDY
ncbi:hypothetical protein [Helicobacter jaachi]|uniref:hypothetical protein n=1 Tax=Helicobacter jaachi TaxID=1677920 RepID=UPI000B0DDF05|nr:hypothetical protein [Helicobacter jaachi]